MSEAPAEPVIAIVVPCYNEEAVLPEIKARLSAKIGQLVSGGKIGKGSFICFVDDGSCDKTWELILQYHKDDPELINGIKLSANCGHQNALLCGLLSLKDRADALISMDADLQDDVDAIDKMAEEFSNGSEIVYGVRSGRAKDSFLKRTAARAFNRLMAFFGVDIVSDHADFRLMGKKALAALSQYGEVNLFLRGIVPRLGFKSAVVYYQRSERFAGHSKYPLHKMLELALDGITSFSLRPIRMIALLGVFIFTLSLALLVFFLALYFSGQSMALWAALLTSLIGMGGLILFSIGLVGEYIGKIYLETKRRPRYHIEEILTAWE